MMEISLLILLIPLLAFLFLGLAGHRLPAKRAGLIGTAGMGLATLFSYFIAWQYFFVDGKIDGVYQKFTPYCAQWLRFTDNLHIDMGIFLHPLSVVMLVIITTVSFMVHLYSLAYMHGEKGFQRYYAFLSLFSFSMLGLVISTNIFQMYVFWELVGVSSYLLIGFYYTKPEAIAASKKAFIITRFADLGFLVGILLLSYFTQTFDFIDLTDNNAAAVVNSSATQISFLGLSAASWAMALIFIGGAGKSAMFPLHVWLPDAMEGPTPVSALIHAATMVVAGVYMVAVLFPVYSFAAPEVLTMIGYVGTFTALFAAVIAMTQTDIKRVLAFSTISQIAYMMTALGVSEYAGGEGYTGSMFHLFTHAFFKALLFLCAGSVIHAIGSNEIGKMGNLRKYMPVTHLTFLIACLSISGFPLFSGFFSKDEILTAVYHKDKLLFVILLFVAALTAFYMFRLYFKVFRGEKREYEHSPHEAPPVMRFTLIALAVLTCVSGFVPFSMFVTSDGIPAPAHINWAIAASGTIVALAGIFAAAVLYRRNNGLTDRIVTSLGGLYKATVNKFYIDEVWMFFTKNMVFKLIAQPITWFDKHVIDGILIDGTARSTEKIANIIKHWQSGQVQSYAVIFVLGTLALSRFVVFDIVIAICAFGLLVFIVPILLKIR